MRRRGTPQRLRRAPPRRASGAPATDRSVRPQPGLACGHDADVRHRARRPRPPAPLAPLHPAAELAGGGLPDHRARRRHDALRHPGQRLHRRRLLAVVQRARPPPPGHRHRHQGPARSRRALDDARPLARPGGQAGQAPGRPRARGAQPRLLLRQRLDRVRDRAQDGLPVPPPARRVVALGLRLPARQLPRRHARLGLGGRHRALPLALPPAALRRLAGAARRRRRAARAAGRARRALRGGHRRAARAGRGGHPRAPRRLPARGARAVRRVRALPHLRRGGHRLRTHGQDVRLRAGGRRRPTSCAWPRGSRAATCRWPRP